LGGGWNNQGGLDPLELLSLLGPEEAIVAHLLEAVGQDMLEEAADELLG
jgi:hypothetical protein